MTSQDLAPVNLDDLKLLKERMKLIADADPNQYHNEFSLKRYLRAFKTVDKAFQVNIIGKEEPPNANGTYIIIFVQAILKTNKWREEYGVKTLGDSAAIKDNSNKARVLKHRDCIGRPVIYIPAKNHNASERDLNDLTKFIVYCLVCFWMVNSWCYIDKHYILLGTSMCKMF